MDSPWTWALVAFALVAMALSYRVPRAWLLVGWGAASFFASTVFGDFISRDIHPFFTAGADAAVCGSILAFYKEDWELGVALAFLISVFSSCVMLGGFLHQSWLYPALLELCNLSAIIWIGTTGVVDLVGKNERSPFHTFRHTLRHARSSV